MSDNDESAEHTPAGDITQRQVQIEESWRQALADEFSADYMQALREFLRQRKQDGAVIYPPSNLWFAAFDHTPLDKVRVVILGQDPYHQPGQAEGLCFSVPEGIRPPPSLVNIFKTIEIDTAKPMDRSSGSLRGWAEPGVLLLNSVLTVEQGQAGAHQGKGWEQFTDAVIDRINQRENPCVFILWGSHAQKKGARVDSQRHLVLKAVHPSPLSAHRGFFECGHFAAVNDWLQSLGEAPIDWHHR